MMVFPLLFFVLFLLKLVHSAEADGEFQSLEVVGGVVLFVRGGFRGAAQRVSNVIFAVRQRFVCSGGVLVPGHAGFGLLAVLIVRIAHSSSDSKGVLWVKWQNRSAFGAPVRVLRFLFRGEVETIVGGVEEVGAALDTVLADAEVGVDGVGAHDPRRQLFGCHLAEVFKVCFGALFQLEALPGFFIGGGTIAVGGALRGGTGQCGLQSGHFADVAHTLCSSCSSRAFSAAFSARSDSMQTVLRSILRARPSNALAKAQGFSP
nr:MAG TPA: hypothetical protein [Caudoviricetes sp.]